MSNYYNIYEEYGLKHYQLPKVFFTNPIYNTLSNDAKIAWAILRDRFSLSKKNGWFEKDTGRIYFVFTNKDLMELLNVKSETTITKIKKELTKANLLEQKRMGLRVPNRLYLLKPIVTENDIYKIDKFEEIPNQNDFVPSPIIDSIRTSKNGVQSNINGTPKNEVQNNINRTPKNEVPELQKMESSNTESINITYKDTYKDTLINNPHVDSFNNIDLKKEQILKDSLRDKMPDKIFEILNIFCETFDEMYGYYGVMLRGKDKACKEHQQEIMFEDAEMEYHNCLLTCFRNRKKINDFNNYLFSSIYKLTDSIICELVKNPNKVLDRNKIHEMAAWLKDIK